MKKALVKKKTDAAHTQEQLVVDVVNTSGEKVATRTLSSALFGVPMKEGLVHLAVVAQAANARVVHAVTKSRGDVRGGGKKPWKQKGTGRARHGSIRSPIWRGGGITFGPRLERNYELKINKKARRKALCMVLSQKVRQGRVVFVDDFAVPNAKTKEAMKILQRLPLPPVEGRRATTGIISPIGSVDLTRAVRNLADVTVIPAHSLNLSKLLQMKRLVMPLKSLDHIEKTYASAH